jgi:hypothetical protein
LTIVCCVILTTELMQIVLVRLSQRVVSGVKVLIGLCVIPTNATAAFMFAYQIASYIK